MLAIIKYRLILVLKIGYIVYLLLINSNEINGQRFNGGVTAGLSMAQIDGDTWSGFNKFGLIAGGFVNTGFNSKIKGQFEVKYVQKGAKTSFNPKDPNIKRTFYQYLEMPVTVNYSIKRDSFRIEAGILLARLLQKPKYADNFGEWPVKDGYHKFDLGSILGISYAINEHLWFNVRYTYSIFRIRKLEVPLTGWWWYYRGEYHNVLNVSVYYQIDK